MTQKSSAKSKKSVPRTGDVTRESGLPSKPKVIRRPANIKSGPENSLAEALTLEREEVMPLEPNTERELIVESPVTATEKESVSSPADTPQKTSPPSPTLPFIDGFDLSGVSLVQQYSIRCAVVLADCCVQPTPEGIFDVLGRNFADVGILMWFLRRIGKGHVADALKGKDIVDAVRKAAHMLARELKEQIGKPVARW